MNSPYLENIDFSLRITTSFSDILKGKYTTIVPIKQGKRKSVRIFIKVVNYFQKSLSLFFKEMYLKENE